MVRVRARAKALVTVRTVGPSAEVDAPATKLLLDLAHLKLAVRGGDSGDGKREGVDGSGDGDGGWPRYGAGSLSPCTETLTNRRG